MGGGSGDGWRERRREEALCAVLLTSVLNLLHRSLSSPSHSSSGFSSLHSFLFSWTVLITFTVGPMPFFCCYSALTFTDKIKRKDDILEYFLCLG